MFDGSYDGKRRMVLPVTTVKLLVFPLFYLTGFFFFFKIPQSAAPGRKENLEGMLRLLPKHVIASGTEASYFENDRSIATHTIAQSLCSYLLHHASIIMSTARLLITVATVFNVLIIKWFHFKI
jgi:hypothetical protein